MGGGSWDSVKYTSSSSARKSAGIDDFAYSKVATKVHDNLDPLRINSKPFGKLESRDSFEHPESNAIIVDFDVTGSNYDRAVIAQKALDQLMTLLPKYITDPQVAIAANDDYTVSPDWSVQISDFESDNRVDDHLRNIKLVGHGGGNDYESYDLILYAAARKTIIDCYEQRGKKGYLFLYADEPLPKKVRRSEVLAVFGDTIAEDIPIKRIVEEAEEMYEVFFLWPVGGYDHARAMYVDLVGEEHVITLQHPDHICAQICAIIGVNEAAVTVDAAKVDLIGAGVSAKVAGDISNALVPLSKLKSIGAASGSLPSLGSDDGAARLS